MKKVIIIGAGPAGITAGYKFYSMLFENYTEKVRGRSERNSSGLGDAENKRTVCSVAY
ncbi:hypothetical protein [Schaedlerella arabinosiphila]|uniref:hypothetical protein n=1 Tax=Schaedlerella arabinosiphila TaxID=2044587 RepID=UPI0012B69D53|nr:hypothetical protein [Schaedlerella arabinosiphila]